MDRSKPFSVVEKFQRAAKKLKGSTKPMPEVFKDFIAETSVMFPEIKEKLVIWDRWEQTAYGNKVSHSTKNHLISEFSYLFSYAEYVPNLDIYVISIAEDRALDKNGCAVLPREADKLMTRLLDHELAHLLIKNLNAHLLNDPSIQTISLDAVMLSEAASDAYVLVREYQRYGVISAFDDPQFSPSARADWMIRGGDVEHFTSFVTDAIISHKLQINFAKLSPLEALQIAENFARVYTPTASEAVRLSTEFNNLLSTVKGKLAWNDSLTRMESVRYKDSLKKRQAAIEQLASNKKSTQSAKLARILLQGR